METEDYFYREEKPKSDSTSVCIRLRKRLKDTLQQIWILTWKNYLIYTRNKFTTILQICSPLLICLYMNLMQGIASNVINKLDNPNPGLFGMDYMNRCFGQDCITLGIGMTNGTAPWVEHVIDYIADSQKLKRGKDIVVLSENNYTDFISHHRINQNKTLISVLFCTGSFILPQNDYVESIPCTVENGVGNLYVYDIVYNYTSSFPISYLEIKTPDYTVTPVFTLKKLMDNAILDFVSKQKQIPTIHIDAEIQPFPMRKSRFGEGYNAVAIEGAFYFMIPSTIIFVNIVSELVREKDSKLRHGLSVIGVSQVAFWLSWGLVALILCLLSSNALILSGYLFQFDLFTNTPYM